MDLQELKEFAAEQHRLLIKHYTAKGNQPSVYATLAKVVEEVGELSEAMLTADALQRSEKLGKQTKLEYEVADVIISTLILAQALGVDIEKALDEKIAKIRARKL